METKNLRIEKEWNEILSKRGSCLSNAPSFIKNDKELVIKAIQKSSLSIAHASLKLRDDSVIANALIKSWSTNYHSTPRSFKFLSSRIKSDKKFSQEAFKKDPRVFLFLDMKFIHDPDFYLKVFKLDNWEHILDLSSYRSTYIFNKQILNPFFTIGTLSKINIASITLHQRIKIYKRMEFYYNENVFLQASILNCLKIDTWQFNHYRDLLYWQYFPSNIERIKQNCLMKGKNCLYCNPPF